MRDVFDLSASEQQRHSQQQTINRKDYQEKFFDRLFDQRQRVFQSNQDLLGVRAGLLKTKGLGVKGEQLDKKGALLAQEFSYESAVREIEKLVRAKDISIDKARQLKTDLEQINQIKLEDIRAQFDPWNQVLVDTQSGFQGFFSDIISGSQSVGDAFSSMVSSIANSLAQLAATAAVNEIVSGIFGMGKGASKSSEGGIWDALMGSNPEFAIADTALKIFGFKDCGVVDPVDHSDYRKGTNPIAKALQREGSRSVLAALTPGEMVLNLEQTRRYHELGVDRVLNFREGGVVPGASTPSFSTSSGGGESIQINIPVQINSNGGSDRDLGRTAAGLGQALRAVVIQEIQNQKRSGGLLQGI